ncbi:MAG: helix-turn-helix domain-containing protein [Lachnospiraceae bacterium]|nr:helix-turn-helix domain-containing protein [Lachnospiraceae bacterium]
MNYFGENFKRLRKDKGLNQEQLAEIFNVADRSTISRWETGSVEPDLDTLIQISDYFDVSLDELIKKEYTKKTLVDDAKLAQAVIADMISKLENLDSVSNKTIEELSINTAEQCMIEGQVCVAEGEYLEAVKYYEKAGVLGYRNGYYQAMLIYEKLRDRFFEIGNIDEGAWCDQQMEICEMRMME